MHFVEKVWIPNFFQLLSFAMMIGVICTIPNLFLVNYRNLFGPIESQLLIKSILCIRTFGNICNFFITLEILLTWYIIEKVLKSKPEMEEVGMAECFTFFTVVISIGLTLISISVGPYFHNYLLKYNGLPFNVFDRLHPK